MAQRSMPITNSEVMLSFMLVHAVLYDVGVLVWFVRVVRGFAFATSVAVAEFVAEGRVTLGLKLFDFRFGDFEVHGLQLMEGSVKPFRR